MERYPHVCHGNKEIKLRANGKSKNWKVCEENRPFAKKKFIFFLESTIKNKLKSKISEF